MANSKHGFKRGMRQILRGGEGLSMASKNYGWMKAPNPEAERFRVGWGEISRGAAFVSCLRSFPGASTVVGPLFETGWWTQWTSALIQQGSSNHLWIVLP